MKTLFGWLVLIAALAIPAVLFWNWWSKVNAESALSASKGKLSSKATFGGVSSSGKRSAPLRAETTTSATVGVSVSTQAAKVALATPSVASGGESSASGGLLVGLEYRPKTDRDPMLSKAERDKLEEERHPKPAPAYEPERRARLEERINLQGIVKTPYGIAALVNDEVKKEGEKIDGVIVYRITTKKVVFKYGSKTFIKTVNK